MKNTVKKSTVMKNAKSAPMHGVGMKRGMWGLVTVLLCGTLSACNPEPAVPAAEMPSPAAEPMVVAPASEPAVADPMTTPAPATDATDTAEQEDDTPHSGGDKVAPR